MPQRPARQSHPFRGPATCSVQGAPVCRVGCCGIACSVLGRSLSALGHTAFDHSGAAPAARAAGGGRRAARGLCDGRADLAGQRGQGAAARPHPATSNPNPSHLRSRPSGLPASRSATGRSRGRGRPASRSRSCTSTRTCTCCSRCGAALTALRPRSCCRESRRECGLVCSARELI